MSMLVFWSLREYDHLPIVRAGRKAFVSQMETMMLETASLAAGAGAIQTAASHNYLIRDQLSIQSKHTKRRLSAPPPPPWPPQA
jgi:hypothetical protein